MTRIALAQITSSTEKTVNLELANQMISEAKNKGARMIAFPEFLMAFSPSTQSPEELGELAEDIDGPFTTISCGCSEKPRCPCTRDDLRKMQLRESCV